MNLLIWIMWVLIRALTFLNVDLLKKVNFQRFVFRIKVSLQMLVIHTKILSVSKVSANNKMGWQRLWVENPSWGFWNINGNVMQHFQLAPQVQQSEPKTRKIFRDCNRTNNDCNSTITVVDGPVTVWKNFHSFRPSSSVYHPMSCHIAYRNWNKPVQDLKLKNARFKIGKKIVWDHNIRFSCLRLLYVTLCFVCCCCNQE